MKKLALLTITLTLLAACSSANDPAQNSTAENSNAPVAANSNSKLIPLEGVNPNQFNSNGSNIPVVNRNREAQEAVVGPRAAPDNSQVNTVQRPDGSFAETRIFKDHPDLSKVERVTNGTTVTVKVYLKNGKVLNVAKEKLQNFNVMAPGNILLAAGIKPAAQNPANPVKEKAPEKEGTEKPN